MAGHTVIAPECGGGPADEATPRVDMLAITVKPVVSQDYLCSARIDSQRVGGGTSLLTIKDMPSKERRFRLKTRRF
jgi:hypothetical protein